MRKHFYNNNRETDYLKALELRKQGLGYRSISKNLSNKIPWNTIKGWVKDISIDSKKAYQKSVELRIKKNPEDLGNNDSIKKLIIKERGTKCEGCGLDFWRNKEIVKELHHKDGNTKNNVRENLLLLCPNCHSQTDNFRKKKDCD